LLEGKTDGTSGQTIQNIGSGVRIVGFDVFVLLFCLAEVLLCLLRRVSARSKSGLRHVYPKVQVRQKWLKMTDRRLGYKGLGWKILGPKLWI
jgi:hypothetical protein